MGVSFLNLPRVDVNDVTKGTIALIGSTIVSVSEHEPYGQEKSPEVIRLASLEYTGFIDYLERSVVDLDVVDLGDFNKDSIGDVVNNVIKQGGEVIVFGGDHSTTFYALRNLRQPNKLTVLDAHLDFADVEINPEAEQYSHGFVNKLLAEKGWKIEIFGYRAYSSFPEEYKEAKHHGAHIIPWFKNEEDLGNVLQKCEFLSIDMDFFDASSFPATRVPEIGGPTLREFISILRRIKQFSVKYIDIVEYTPDLDPHRVYAKMLSILIMELIGAMAYKT